GAIGFVPRRHRWVRSAPAWLGSFGEVAVGDAPCISAQRTGALVGSFRFKAAADPDRGEGRRGAGGGGGLSPSGLCKGDGRKGPESASGGSGGSSRGSGESRTGVATRAGTRVTTGKKPSEGVARRRSQRGE